MRLTDITIDSKLQMRVTMDKDVITDYANALLRGEKFPPVVVFSDGDNNWLGDGNNRYFAHKQAGFPEIEAIVKEGTYEDALKYAMIKANRDNGQRYTNADKRKIIVNALDHPEYGKLNDSQLHAIFDVSRPFIAKIRLELNKPQPDVITAIRNGVEVQMRNPKLDLKKEVIDETPEPIEENTVITELSHTVQELAEENKKLEARVAVAAMDATDEEKASASQIISDLQEQVKILEADNRVLKASRDSFQAEANEAKKQAMYGKRRYEKAEKDLADAVKRISELQRKLDLAEADLAMR